MDSYALDQLPWNYVEQALDEDQRLIFPVGALEQHGPHLPLGANVIIARRVAREVSESLGILRAPTFSYGVTVGGGPYPGQAGVRRKTLHRAVNELFAAWEDQGFEHFVVITAHRFEPHLEALLMALTTRSTKAIYDLYEIDVADLIETDPESEHAGELETSLLLHLTPDLVHPEKFEDFMPAGGRALRRYTRRRVPKPPRDSLGVMGFPASATAEKGAKIFRRYVDALSAELRATRGANGV